MVVTAVVTVVTVAVADVVVAVVTFAPQKMTIRQLLA